MTKHELNKVESLFALKLPQQYRALMLNYPFVDDSWANDCAMPNDPQIVIEMNKDKSFLGKFTQEPSRYFQIGSDGGEFYYYIDLQNPDCPVYAADLETGSFSQEASDFKIWVQQLNNADEEIRLDRIEMSRKRWWQFWR